MINTYILAALIILAVYIQINCIRCAKIAYYQLTKSFRGHKEEKRVKAVSIIVGTIFNIIVFLCMSIPLYYFF